MVTNITCGVVGWGGLKGDTTWFYFALLCLLVQFWFFLDPSLPDKVFVGTHSSGYTDLSGLDRVDSWRWEEAEITLTKYCRALSIY